MKLGTRLLVTLLPATGLIMLAYTSWALIQRQAVVLSEARLETEAYAVTLALALDYDERERRLRDAQGMIDRLSRQPKVYGVLVYDRDGRPMFVSQPLTASATAPRDVLERVLGGETVTLERVIDGQRVYSALQPIHDASGQVEGALEVAQPLTLVAAEMTRTRQRFLWNTLTLLAALALLTLWLVRRFVARPMGRFVAAVRALARGELAHRVPPDAAGGELGELAREFNRMADRLERARAELLDETEERIALERRLRETEKMAAVGKLAAGLAHEIAAPLNVISGRAEMLVKRGQLPTGQERYLRIIVEQIGRITTIVRNLLDFARRREPSLQPTDLAGILDGVFEFLEGELARGRVLVDRQDPRPLWVLADPNLLHQLFVNLVLNAIQAMDGSQRERRIVVRLGDGAGAETSGRAVLEIADTGPGISDEALAHIFDPFFTTKPAGTGLGLVVARSIVEEHGGLLEAHNAPGGGGAIFRLSLTRDTAAATAHV